MGRKRAGSQRRELEITPKKKIQLQRTNEQPANKKITEFFDNNQKVKQKRISEKRRKQKLSEDLNDLRIYRLCIYGLDVDEQIQRQLDSLQVANKALVEKEILLKEKYMVIDQLQFENKDIKEQKKELKQ